MNELIQKVLANFPSHLLLNPLACDKATVTLYIM